MPVFQRNILAEVTKLGGGGLGLKMGPEKGHFFSTFFTSYPAPLSNLLEDSLLVQTLLPYSLCLIVPFPLVFLPLTLYKPSTSLPLLAPCSGFWGRRCEFSHLFTPRGQMHVLIVEKLGQAHAQSWDQEGAGGVAHSCAGRHATQIVRTRMLRRTVPVLDTIVSVVRGPYVAKVHSLPNVCKWKWKMYNAPKWPL
jgi:hypothetical protein